MSLPPFVYIGPKPMQEVVVMAVRAAVMAATMTFRMISKMFFPFILSWILVSHTGCTPC